MKSFSRRSDGPAALWFGGHFALVIGLGVGIALTWGTAWSLLFTILYGLVWGAAASGVHETCHGTPFRSRWLNELALWAFGWMVQMEPVSVRWGHAGHHSFTHFDEGDTELSEPNPVSWRNFLSVGSGIGGALFYWRALVCQAVGSITPEMRQVIPPAEMPKAIWNARLMVASYAAMLLWAALAESWLPIVLVFLPRFLGGPVTGLLHLTQHTCLQMNVRDHRFSTRSFMAGPVTRFFYFNMNYHIEHHMFPMVPFYNLPRLNAAVRDQLPAPCDGLIGVYSEILTAIRRQHREPGYFIRRAVPDIS